jgi:uncharacterized protein
VRHAAALLALLLAVPAAAAEVATPFLSGRVVDQADLLPPEAEAAIGQKAAQLEQETGAQVVVLTVPTIGDQPIEDFSVRVAQAWKLGREEVDDGVLFVVAQQERALRIEVGYGLEPKLTDITSKRIIEELVVPRFRDGDFPGGIAAGVDAIAAVVRGGDPLPPPRPSGNQLVGLPGGGRAGMLLGFLVFLVPFALAAIFTPGCVGWVIWAVLTPFIAGLPFAALGRPGLAFAVLWLLVVPPVRVWLQRSKVGRRFTQGRTSRSRGGGWVIGPTWGGGRGGGFGGGFGGGGFGGGGGSFGGGGASGRW